MALETEAELAPPELLRALDEFNELAPPELLLALDELNELAPPELLLVFDEFSELTLPAEDVPVVVVLVPPFATLDCQSTPSQSGGNDLLCSANLAHLLSRSNL